MKNLQINSSIATDVSGHQLDIFRYQCTVCKSNIDDCCSGDTCQPTMSTLKEEDLINHEVKA